MAKDKNAKADPAGRPRDPLKKLRKMIKNTRVAMLTTVSADGALRSRPMAIPGKGLDGALWFVTRADSSKSGEIQRNQRVNVSFASPKNGRYVSVSGTATLVQDTEAVKSLWRGEYKAWFPGGKNDPELVALQVTVEKAEYWDDAENRMVDVGRPVAGPEAPAVPAVPQATPTPGGAEA